MTDNFERYREFINICGGLPDTNEKGTLDKYYVIELIRRGKDNPDMSAANYHFRNYIFTLGMTMRSMSRRLKIYVLF